MIALVLRRGMKVPSADYVDQVLAAAGVAAETRVALSQPVWFKDAETFDNLCNGLVETFAPKYGLDDPSVRHHKVDGPDGCACLIVELE
jgi:hypothetical protein